MSAERTPGGALRPEHSRQLSTFGIPPEILEAAGVRSVTDAEARDEFGIRGQGDMIGLIFPYLDPITGVGPVTATALVAAIGNGAAFRKGRDLAAWVGLVPRECSTGGKQKLLGISKRGHIYLRRLFVQGARSVLQYHQKQAPALASWLKQLLARRHQNVVIVALANKLVRAAWAVLCRNQPYCVATPAISS